MEFENLLEGYKLEVFRRGNSEKARRLGSVSDVYEERNHGGGRSFYMHFSPYCLESPKFWESSHLIAKQSLSNHYLLKCFAQDCLGTLERWDPCCALDRPIGQKSHLKRDSISTTQMPFHTAKSKQHAMPRLFKHTSTQPLRYESGLIMLRAGMIAPLRIGEGGSATVFAMLETRRRLFCYR